MMPKGRVQCILSIMLFVNVVSLCILSGLILFSYISVDADSVSRSFQGIGYEATGDDNPYIYVDHGFNLADTDWSITLIGRFNNLNDTACFSEFICGPTDTNMLSVYNRSGGGGGGSLLLHLQQYGGIELTRDYLTGFTQGSCLTVGGLAPEDAEAFLGCDQSLLPAFSPDAFELQEGEWYYFTIVHDESEQLVTYYVDGQELSSFNIDLGDTWSDAGFVMGVNRSLQTQFLDGNISQFRFYSRVLLPTEVQAWVLNNIRPIGSLEVEYLFQGLETNVVEDTSGKNRDATVMNFLEWSTEAPQPWYAPPANATLQEFTVPDPVTLRMIEVPAALTPGDEFSVEWAYNRGIAYINLYWRASEESEWVQINEDRVSARSGRFKWTVPQDLTSETLYVKVAGNDLLEDFIEVEVTIPITEGIEIGDAPPLQSKRESTSSSEEDAVISPGTIIKGESFDAIYFFSHEGERRPIVSKAIFDSYALLRDNIITIPDDQLAEIPIGNPLLPKPGRSLIAFDALTGTYIPLTDDIYEKEGYITLAPDNEVLRMILGPVPEDYILTLPVYFFEYYNMETVTEAEAIKLLETLAR